MKPKLLFLFPDGWDEAAIDAVPGIGREHEVVREGFDIFRFPENAKLLWFDARRFVAALVRRYRNSGVAGGPCRPTSSMARCSRRRSPVSSACAAPIPRQSFARSTSTTRAKRSPPRYPTPIPISRCCRTASRTRTSWRTRRRLRILSSSSRSRRPIPCSRAASTTRGRCSAISHSVALKRI